MRAAANIARDRRTELFGSNTGRQLIHLLSRLELATYRVFAVQDVRAIDFSRWKNLTFYTQTSTTDDMHNGNVDFEIAWTGLMKIMAQVVELRQVLTRWGTTKDKLDTEQRIVKGEEILELLRLWESSLPESFSPVTEPQQIINVPNRPILPELRPIYYRSLNVAVVMGTQFIHTSHI